MAVTISGACAAFVLARVRGRAWFRHGRDQGGASPGLLTRVHEVARTWGKPTGLWHEKLSFLRRILVPRVVNEASRGSSRGRGP
jgi:hypothetical protein